MVVRPPVLLAVLLSAGAASAVAQPPGPQSADDERGRRFRRTFAPVSAADAAVLARHGRRDAAVHDPTSIVRCGDEYWLFATGRGIASWRSTDLKDWQPGPRVFAEPPAWALEAVPEHRGRYWAPAVLRHGDRYLLYYSVSTFGKNRSAIGLATSPTLDPDDPAYRWTDHGPVVQSRPGDDFNAIDPAVLATADGGLWLAFGSFWSGLKLVRLDSATGLRAEPDAAPIALADAPDDQIEAPLLAERDGFYYLFFNRGLCCRGTESTYEIRVGRSRSVEGPYLDRDGRPLLGGGGTLLSETDGPFIGPGHAGLLEEDGRTWFGCHFYDGARRGRATLALQELRWDEDGWPRLLPPPDAAPSDAE
ncbi:arabinan endo-1,5-alpha-L-arabinosidase [Alienimonas sp. DA493]|uniref:arabinan endo-1,5-alpha-L-arabinosidase n=1 Tax=Alienimonas sp. DA493 TaxID=3373605 RepID=UPI003754EDFA